MGASASVELTSKGSILGVSDVKEILKLLELSSTEYLTMDKVYPGLQMKEGGVDRNELLSILADKCEQEVFVLFLKFSGGEMAADIFVSFCRLLKLLSRRDFSVESALRLFRENAYSNKEGTSQKINYRVFRFDILPEISSLKGRSIREMVNKFCWLVISDDEIGQKHQIENFSSGDSVDCHQPSAINSAVLCIQNFSRRVLARRQMDEEREIKYIEKCPSPMRSPPPAKRSVPPSQDLNISLSNNTDLLKSEQLSSKSGKGSRVVSSPAMSPGQPKRKPQGNSSAQEAVSSTTLTATICVEESPTEEEIEKCRVVFKKFCSSPAQDATLSSHDFVRLCYDTALIPFDSARVDFTAMQARHIFRKAVALLFDPQQNVYEEGVVFGKRVSFSVFLEVLVPEVAQIKGQSSIEVIKHINSNSGVQRMYTSADGPPVISLLSNAFHMHSRCDSFESVQFDISDVGRPESVLQQVLNSN